MELNQSLRIFCILIFAATAGCSRPTCTSQAFFAETYVGFEYCEMTVIKQSHSNSCGSASLTAILNYWGVETTERQLLEEFGPLPQDGFSIARLLTIAKSKGLQAYAFSMSPRPLEKLTEQIHKGRPIICIVKMPQALYVGYDVPLFGDIYRRLSWMIGPRRNHSIVVFGTKDDQFLIMDPAYGFTTFSNDDLSDAWGKQKNVAVLCARPSEKHTARKEQRISEEMTD